MAYVESIKVGSGETWPVRDVEAHNAISTLEATVDAAQVAADNAQTTADTAKNTANAAMPKAGGTFTGNVIAYSTADTANRMRNAIVQNSSGTAVSTNYFIFQRK